MSETLQPAPGNYRHYKGKDCEVLHVARHSETEELPVVYRPLDDESGVRVRPLEMFMETIAVNGKVVPRFYLMKE